MENDMTFVAPEGVYSVTEEHKPTGHTINANPNLYPTRLSTVHVRFPTTKAASQGFAQLLGGGNKDAKKDKEQQRPGKQDDNASVSSSDTDGSPDPSSATGQPDVAQSPVLLDQPTLFSRPSTSGGKKKAAARPKHNMRTTSSTFITRLHTAEGLTKALQSKQGDVQFFFYNSAKSFFWTEAGAKQKEPYARITFSAYPTCHDVNLSTVSTDRLDVVIGFSTGDLIWFDPMSARYARLNKGGCITSSPCTAVRWVPSSPTLFLASHADGTVIVYDKERDDGAFTAADPEAPPASVTEPAFPMDNDLRDAGGEWNPLYSIFVTMPPWHPATVAGTGPPVSGKPEKEKTVKNPVSHWRVARRAIVDFVFSPDVKYVAAISEDGCLRVIDALAEQLVDCYASYFGALTSVAWSPDGRFILTGGQDDLVTIISPWEQRVIARGQGHSSFVSALAFDEARCDGRTYRFGSVGEDNKLILWDFSSGALHRPKLHATPHSHQRLSMAMASSLSLAGRRAGASALHLPPLGADGALPRFHPAPSRNEVAVVQPVLIKQLESDLLTDLAFLPRGMLTTAKTGHTKLWIRPLALRTRNMNKARRQSLSDAQDVM